MYLVGELEELHREIVKDVFYKTNTNFEFLAMERVTRDHEGQLISLSKNASSELNERGIFFYNWDLLFSVLGPNDKGQDIEPKLEERIRILKSIQSVKNIPQGEEFHGSIRVHDLARSTAFYTWLFGVQPKEWTHRYVTFQRKDAKFNFVLLVSDGKELHHDTLYHLGMGVESKEKVLEFFQSAKENGFHIEKPARTTWRGTPLHELWLKDPDGTLIEVYARLTPEELKQMPEDKEPLFL